MASFRRCLLALGAAEFSGVAALQVGTEQQPRLCWKMCKTNADGIESSLVENNLGGAGPTNGEQRMVYKKIAQEGPHHLDLHVTVNPRSHEEFGAYSPWNSTVNGQHKCFGVVNVRNRETVMLDFAFYEHDTGNIHVPNKPFGFTIFDVDQSAEAGQHEMVLFNTPPLPGQTVVGEDLIRDDSGSTGDLRITSKAIGNGADNPLDANGNWAPLPEEVSRQRAIDVTYKDEAKWTVTFSSQGGHRGRNFLFYGCEDGGPDAFVGDGSKRQKRGKKAKHKGHKALESDTPSLPSTPDMPNKPTMPDKPTVPNKPTVPSKPPVPDKSSLPPVPGAAEAAKIAVPVVATLVAAVFA